MLFIPGRDSQPWGSEPAHSRRRSVRVRRVAAITLGPEGLEERRLMTYLPPISYAVGTNPGGVAVGDFNADGKPDMAVANQAASGTVSVLLGDGSGGFLPKVDYAAGASAVDVKSGDLNADGKLDLAVVGYGSVSVLLGNGDGSFAAPASTPSGVSSHSINLADFNGDGRLDVATMNGNTASVLLGNGDGTLRPRIDTAIPGNSTNTVVGDFNRDGRTDLATSNTASVGTITVLRGRGDGSFDPALSYAAFSAPVYLASGDFNEDGYDDFAVANSYAASSMSVVLNNGDGSYTPPTTYGIGETGYEIEAGDFNNDGHDDFGVRGASRYMVQYGKGDGQFYPAVNYATPTGRFESGGSGDLNGDGSVDFVYPSTSGVTVVTNAADDRSNLAGAGRFVISAPTSSTSGSSLPLTVSAVDAAGRIVAGFRGTVYVTSSDPAAASTLVYTFTPPTPGPTPSAGRSGW